LCSAGHDSIWRSAFTGGDTSLVSRRLIPGHSPYEPVVGYSRAVVSGASVHVSGTAPIPREGDPPEGAYEQARLCLEIVGGALGEAGTDFEHVVRTRIYLTDAGDYEEIARAHGEVFAEIRPASTAVVVKGLLDPRWHVELEAEAVLRS
jgi:enamine deaminase RidA (YjgF/YER057c/UK114 family)